jgi:hypothetical protein
MMAKGGRVRPSMLPQRARLIQLGLGGRVGIAVTVAAEQVVEGPAVLASFTVRSDSV